MRRPDRPRRRPTAAKPVALRLADARTRADQNGIAYPEQLLGAHIASSEHEPARLDIGQAERLVPWARAPGRCWIHRSEDGGRSWAGGTVLETKPFVGGYGMRGGIVLADGTIVLPLGDVPDYRRVFVVRSEDEGATWSTPIELATLPDRRFEEPAPLLLGSGRVLALLRENASRSLWRSWSDDGGLSWAEPVPTGIDGYPAHLTGLPDGRILCTYGFRRPPYAIRPTISSDEDNTWSSPVEIRTGLPNSDLGYPCTLPTAAALCTVYYAQDQNECTCILVTHWTLPTHI